MTGSTVGTYSSVGQYLVRTFHLSFVGHPIKKLNFPELGFFNVRVNPNLAWADLRDDSRVDPRNSGQDSSYSRVK